MSLKSFDKRNVTSCRVFLMDSNAKNEVSLLLFMDTLLFLRSPRYDIYIIIMMINRGHEILIRGHEVCSWTAE